MTRCRATSASSLALLLLLLPRVAHAADTAGAEALFRDAKKLIAEGKTHEACVKFAASEQAEPALGTLLALAACHERDEKYASAWSEYTEAAGVARSQNDVERGEYAKTHATAMEGKLYRVTLAMTAPPADLKLTIGENVYGAGANGTSIPLDPGTYEVVAAASGKKSWKQPLTVPKTKGESSVAVPKLEDVAVVATESKSSVSTRQIVGIGVAGAGVVLAGVGAVLWIHSGSQSDDAVKEANDANRSKNQAAYDTAQSAHDRAATNQLIGIIGVGVGAAAIGLGGVLFFTGGEDKSEKPARGKSWLSLEPFIGSTVGVRGAF